MFSVYQHWDPLRVCAVGRSYPPEFYSWIKDSHVRSLFEKIAIETEEDFVKIINKLEEFGIQVVRPNIDNNFEQIKTPTGFYPVPPMTPRDKTIMVGKEFYHTVHCLDDFYQQIRDEAWPEQCLTWEDFRSLPQFIQDECYALHHIGDIEKNFVDSNCYRDIFELVAQQGNSVNRVPTPYSEIMSGAMISRIGKDLYFGTATYDYDPLTYQQYITHTFPNTRNHIVNTGGHSDSTYCPVCPGLIISSYDVPNYEKTFPGWEVVYLPPPNWNKVDKFLQLKQRNQGKWWIPGFESDNSVIDVVETWLNHWVGYVAETVFDINMLIIDPKNVIVFGYNKQVFDALERYNVTPHIIPFRHRYFWDGGIHCVTSDLNRIGSMQNFFPDTWEK